MTDVPVKRGTATIEVDNSTLGKLLKTHEVKILRVGNWDAETQLCLVSSNLLLPGYNGRMIASFKNGVLEFEEGNLQIGKQR